MKKITMIILCLAMALSLVACQSTPDPAPATNELTPPSSPQMIQICGATSGGTYFLVSNGIAQLLNSEYSEWFRASAQSTGGTPANIRLMQDKETDFAFGQAGVALQAYRGEGDFEQVYDNISSVSYMYPNVMQVIVRQGSGIETLSDLAGKTFCVGASGSATELNSRDLLEAVGMYADGAYNGVRVEYTSEAQSSELLQNMQADGANLIAALGSSVMTELTSSGKFDVYSFTDEELAAVLALSDAYYAFEIPAGTYPNQTEPVQTFAVANYMFARADLDEDIVYMFTKAMYENTDVMATTHAILSNFNIDNREDGLTIPMHPGAQRYYDEVVG